MRLSRNRESLDHFSRLDDKLRLTQKACGSTDIQGIASSRVDCDGNVSAVTVKVAMLMTLVIMFVMVLMMLGMILVMMRVTILIVDVK